MKPTDKAKVAVVIAACLIGLVIVLKNVLLVPADVLSQDVIWYIIIYGVFFVTLNFTAEEDVPRKGTKSRKAYDSPWVWSAVIVVVTLAIIALYAYG